MIHQTEAVQEGAGGPTDLAREEEEDVQEEVGQPIDFSRWRPALAVGAAGFAFLGQYLLSNVKTHVPDALALYALAIAAFLPLAWKPGGLVEREQEVRRRRQPKILWLIARSPTRTSLVLFGFALAVVTLRLIQSKSGFVSYLDAVAFWIAGGVAFAAAFAFPKRVDLRAWFQAHRMELLAVGGLTLIAGLLRFVALGDVPSIVNGDEGRIGRLGLQTMQGQIVDPFRTFFGHSTLYLFFIGFPQAILGASATSLRVMSALPGTLTIPLVYLLGRRMFGPRVGFVAAALLAFSHFHIHFSRLIVNGGIMDALFAGVAIYFLYKGLEEGKALDFALAGATIALHLYFYMGGRLMALLVPVYLVGLLVVDRRRALANLRNYAVLLGAFVIVGTPIFYWFYSQPNEFMARASAVGIFQNNWLQERSALTGQSQAFLLWDQFAASMLAFVYYPATGFYEASVPMFDFLTSMPLVLGIAYSLARTFDWRFLLLNGYIFASVALGQVAVVHPWEGAYRIVIMMPAAVIVAAVALAKWSDLGLGLILKDGRLRTALLGVLLLAVASFNVNYYFRDWANLPTYTGHSGRMSSVIGRYLGTLDRDYRAYFYALPGLQYGLHPSIEYLSRELPVANVMQPVAGPLTFVDRNRSAVFLFVPERERELAQVQQQFPDGTRRELYDVGNKLMIVAYEVPRRPGG